MVSPLYLGGIRFREVMAQLRMADVPFKSSTPSLPIWALLEQELANCYLPPIFHVTRELRMVFAFLNG